MTGGKPPYVEARPLPKPLTLNTSHRCDQCGQQAYVLVTLNANAELLFCAHHYAANETALMERDPLPWVIVDERDRIT